MVRLAERRVGLLREQECVQNGIDSPKPVPDGETLVHPICSRPTFIGGNNEGADHMSARDEWYQRLHGGMAACAPGPGEHGRIPDEFATVTCFHCKAYDAVAPGGTGQQAAVRTAVCAPGSR